MIQTQSLKKLDSLELVWDSDVLFDRFAHQYLPDLYEDIKKEHLTTEEKKKMIAQADLLLEKINLLFTEWNKRMQQKKKRILQSLEADMTAYEQAHLPF